MIRAAFFSIAILLLACSCGSESRPVPKPEAFPRIDVCPEEYRNLHELNINSCAEIVTDSVKSNGAVWITARYPKYNATLYVTKISHSREDMVREISERVRRIELNAGGGKIERNVRSIPGGMEQQIFVARRGSAHPVQLLAVDMKKNEIISAATVLEDYSEKTDPDSIAPVIDALKRDLMALIER